MQLGVWPIMATIGLGLLVVLVTFLVAKGMGPRPTNEMQWLAMFASHATMLVIALGTDCLAD